MRASLPGLALTFVLPAVSAQPAQALDCEFAIRMYELNAAACAAGDSGVCARLPPFEKNYQACSTEARKPAGAEPAAAAEPALPAPKPAEAEGDPLVKEVQVLLAATGFDPGPADGRAGPATCAAAEAFAGSRKLAVGCADMVALRDALKRALSDGTSPPPGCALAEKITDDKVISIWHERQGVLVSIFEDHLRDLDELEAGMQGDLATLGGLRTAWRETVLTVKASAKLALGIGAAATAIAGMPATAVVLLEALAVIAAAELVDDAMRYWFDRELLDSSAPDIKVIELGDKMIDQTLDGLIAIIEGSFEIKDIGERMRKESETRAVLMEQIARQRRDIGEAMETVRLNRGYETFLAALREARKTCAETTMEPRIDLP